MKIRSKLTIGLVSSVMCVAALAHAAGEYKKAKAKVDEEGITFDAKAPGNMAIDGTVPGVAVAKEENGKLLFKVELEKLKTGIALRDTHTKKMLRVDQGPKYQMAELRVPKNVDPKGKEVVGSFTLNGVTKDLKIKYKAVAATDNSDTPKPVLKLTAHFTVDVLQFGVTKEQICYMGVCADSRAEVTAHVAVYPPAE